MSYIDLQSTLSEWPYDAEQISVRKILGTDGLVRIQMRVELGVLQMEADGRPDGARPHGCESLLEYHRQRLTKCEVRDGTAVGFTLSPQECHDLRVEASLFYRRYVSFFVLEEYEAVVRDTSHNLAIFDLCREYAQETDDQNCMEPFRPYVLMMNARARALHAEEKQEYASAIAHVNRGIMHIRACYEEHGTPEAVENCEEIKLLRPLLNELSRKMPPDSITTIRKTLQLAIDKEQFEEAARLRDMLEDLQQDSA